MQFLEIKPGYVFEQLHHYTIIFIYILVQFRSVEMKLKSGFFIKKLAIHEKNLQDNHFTFNYFG